MKGNRVLTLENGILREREEWMNKISKLEKKVAELTKVNLENENERLNCSQMVLSEKSILYREQRIWDNKVNQLRESLESERAKHSADILHLQEKALKLENEKLNISAEMMQLGYQMLIANERIAQVETTNVQTASELQHQAANLAQCETQLANVWSQLRNETEMNRILQQKLQNEHDSQSKVRVKYLKQTMGDQDTALEYNQNKNVDDTGNTLEDLGNYGYGEIQTNEISAVDGSQFELVKTDKLEFVVAQVVENKNKTDQILMDIADIENKLEMLPLARIWANFDQMQNVLDNSTAQIDDLNTTLHSLAAFVHMKLGMNQSSLTGMLDQQTTQIENHVLNFTKYLHCLLPEKPKDCSEICFLKQRTNPVQTIYIANSSISVNVRCQEAWTIIQHKSIEGAVGFDRNWDEYKHGFGNVTDNFWLGNEFIHQITREGNYKLWIDILSSDDVWYYAEYVQFSLGGEADNYRLFVKGYQGSAPDALISSNEQNRAHGQQFTTRDRDNDAWDGGNNADAYGAGWWYNYGTNAPLNAKKFWIDGKWGLSYLKSVTMKIKPVK